MLKPTISLIIPCYNQAIFLEECLSSVLHQTFTDWECILINDGSTDNTEEICKNWVEKDTRFSYIFKENSGVSASRNLGLQKATGDFIQFLDADDKIDFRKKKKKMAFSAENQIILSEFNILTNKQYFPGYNRLKKEYLDWETLFLGWETRFTIPIHTALISRKLLKDFQFDTTLFCFEDYLMWLHITAKKPVCEFIDEPLVSYRKESNLQSASSDLTNLVTERIKVLPLIKAEFGEEKHDKLVYHLLFLQSVENLKIKKEYQKIYNEKLISKYLKLKRWYYKVTEKTKNT